MRSSRLPALVGRPAHGTGTRGRAQWSGAFGLVGLVSDLPETICTLDQRGRFVNPRGENQTPICFACFELPDAIVLAIPLLPSAVVREKPQKTRHPYFCPRFGLPDAIVLAIPLLPSAVVREKPGRTRHGAWRPTASLLPTDRPAKFQTKIPDNRAWNDCRRLRELSPDGSGAPPPTCDTASRTPSAAKFRAVSGLLSKSA